jgi:hypothetical protein
MLLEGVLGSEVLCGEPGGDDSKLNLKREQQDGVVKSRSFYTW